MTLYLSMKKETDWLEVVSWISQAEILWTNRSIFLQSWHVSSSNADATLSLKESFHKCFSDLENEIRKNNILLELLYMQWE